MRQARKILGVVAVLAVLMAGCGDDDDGGDESAGTTTTAKAGQGLDGFLIRAGEAPGLSPSGEPTRLASLSALVDEFNASPAEEQRLRDHGFESSVNQMLAGTGDAAGISAVDLFASEDGAARELAYLVGNKEKDAAPGIENFVRFDVPGAPGAVGWTFDKPGGSKAADVHWVQGRCVFSLGSEPPSIDALRAGVKALYERTGGRCP